MHDYHKALEMVSYAKEKAQELGKSKVIKISLTVGESSGYTPDSIRMYFNDVSKGTICEGAAVEIESVPSMLKCPKCGEVFERRLMHYECPKCGEEGAPSEIGTAVVIESIEAV